MFRLLTELSFILKLRSHGVSRHGSFIWGWEGQDGVGGGWREGIEG